MTIREFLNAQYDAEENAARIAAGQPMAAANVSRWHPRHVLADLASKRAVMAYAAKVDRLAEVIHGEYSSYPDEEGDDLLRILAAPYADREGYDERWRI